VIGPLEIAILVVIVLIFFGGYKRLPQLGRSAGEGARRLGDAAMQKGEKAKELAAETKEKHGEKLDPGDLARRAGKGAREAREFRDSLTGKGATKPAAAATPPAPTPETPKRERESEPT
jgi:TatA/E family protein of Tat protein translocase